VSFIRAQTQPFRIRKVRALRQALKIATINGAYLSFDEEKKGSLEPDKLADLAVLSDNPLTVEEKSIADITSLMTMVGGRLVHQSPSWNG